MANYGGSYGETLYAAMLRAQQQQAEQGWLQAERERELSAGRQDAGFDKMTRVIQMMQQAQDAEHKRKLEMAKVMGASGAQMPEHMAGKQQFEETYGAQRQAAQAMATMQKAAQEREQQQKMALAEYETGLKDEMQGRKLESQDLYRRQEEERALKAGMIPPGWKQPWTPARRSRITKTPAEGLSKAIDKRIQVLNSEAARYAFQSKGAKAEDYMAQLNAMKGALERNPNNREVLRRVSMEFDSLFPPEIQEMLSRVEGGSPARVGPSIPTAKPLSAREQWIRSRSGGR